MRINIRTLLLGAILSLGAGCASQSDSTKSDAMISSAKSVDASIVTAFNQGDAEKISALYWNSPDLVLYPPDAMEFRGWQAVHDAYVETVKALSGAQLQLIEQPQYFVAGDYVICNGRWKLSFSDGKEILGRYSSVVTSKDGKWVYVLDHISEPALAPPASQPSQ